MYCPRCGCEYREGYDTCADCNAPLVQKPLDDDASDAEPVEFEEVLKTFNPADIMVIRSLLDANEIEYYIQNQFFGQLAYSAVIPAVVMVRKDQADDARELLKELIVHYYSSSPRGNMPE